MFSFCSNKLVVAIWGDSDGYTMVIQHDVRLRAAARVIYDACYPSEEWSPVAFEDAERLCTIHYRQAVDAALLTRALLVGEAASQLVLI